MAEKSAPLNVVNIVSMAQERPVTKALYDAKANGPHPVLRVQISPEGVADYATLRLDGLTYYFHATKDKDGNRLEPQTEEGTEGYTIAVIPFDGWGLM